MDASEGGGPRGSASGPHHRSQRTKPPRHQKGAGSSKRYQSTRQGAEASFKSENPRYQESNNRNKNDSSRSNYYSHENQSTNDSKPHHSKQKSDSRMTTLNVNADCFYPKSNTYQTNLAKDGSESSPNLGLSVQNTNSIGCVVDGRYVKKSAVATSNSNTNNTVDYRQAGRGRGRVPQTENDFQQRQYQRNYRQRNNDSNGNQASYSSSSTYDSKNVYDRNSHSKTYYNPQNNQNSNQVFYNSNNSFRNSSKGERSSKTQNYLSNNDDYEKEVAAISKKRNNRESFQAAEKTDARLPNKSTSRLKFKESIPQRDRQIQQLEEGNYECMVCCERVTVRDYIWSCCNCYHIFHLRCIKKWAKTAATNDEGWRCPACQRITQDFPHNYYCFCGKKKNPEVNAHYIPHSCGEVCGKKREDENCCHNCTLLCHPGPCPPCLATVTRSCECGKSSKTVLCNHSEPITCGSTCEKILNCGVHMCTEPCHKGPCSPCATILEQECYCRSSTREILCDEVTSGQQHYSCKMTCGKLLTCGNHNCTSICHSGSCDTCKLLPEHILSCPCGKTLLEDLYASGKASRRVSCVDPIPLCGQKCEKELPCGPKDSHHRCASDCHVGECPPCSLVTIVKCQCSSTSKEISCKDLVIPHVFKCEKRCNKRKNCGRHKCLNNCCVVKSHMCELVCNKKLSCGSHQCQETCHAGNCPTCWNVSFDELRCHCGHSVLYPPIHCGTRPPECDQPCIKSHDCDHKVQHTCHSEPTCPPCTVLVEKMCFGGHEKRSNVQCFLDGISCGRPCDKPLPCGNHKCRETCHTGACMKSDAICTQPCETQRSCGHPCNAPCHSGPCPDNPCKAKVTVTCPCGFRSESATCTEEVGAYRLVSVSRMAAKMNDIKLGESVSMDDIFGKKNKYNRLLCNEDCAIHERNKRLAVALQIQNPDLSCKPGPPTYSEFLKEEARKNPKFVASVYDKFTEIVQLAKQSKQKSRSYAFPPMKRDQRRVVHEIAEFFGCETQSYDEEPVKNVVMTAFKDRSWLPFVSLATVVEREMGLRRGPAPLISAASKVPVQVSVATERKTKQIDYFDYEG